MTMIAESIQLYNMLTTWTMPELLPGHRFLSAVQKTLRTALQELVGGLLDDFLGQRA
jgi:hypothetical protein